TPDEIEPTITLMRQARAAAGTDGILSAEEAATLAAGTDVALLRRMLEADQLLKPTVDVGTASVEQVTGALRTLNVQLAPAGSGPGPVPGGGGAPPGGRAPGG
ncbi:MAG: hypothetical protein K2Q01_08840, partial [Rickettsiales bacterium]|nr:hypothetical protein [Rickettsiales bacterium]